jgi:NAD(P)-dependent dehydrogenase (short-subunit alcohol dehydrogenase family)
VIGRLDGSVAVVTGAAGGLGSAVAATLAERGASLVLLDVSLDALAPVVDRLERAGAAAPLALACDVSDVELVDDAAREVDHRHGRCDILVNNAAVYRRAPLDAHPLELWDLTMAVNLRGYFLCMRAFGRSMLARGAGSIVNVSSIAARGPTPNAVSYCASKAAILALTRQAALEWGPRGIRANSISPGFMSTPMSSAFGSADLVHARETRVPVQRIATTDEVARVVAFLAGDAASYVNGADLTVDGGLTQTLSQSFPR